VGHAGVGPEVWVVETYGMVEVDGEVEAVMMWHRGRLHRGRWRQRDVKGGDDGASSVLREAMVCHRGRQHRGRQQWHGVGVEGGDDDAEGGGGKSGSLTAQNQIFTASYGFVLAGYSPLYPGIIRIGWHSAADTKNDIIGID
jgi:hypothetical protein